MMHGRKKSDSVIVAGKPTKKAATVAAEPVEPRTGAKGNASQQSTHRTQSRKTRVTRAGAHTARSPSHTQGGSRVREFRSHGSGRVSNDRPYRTSSRVFRILIQSGPLLHQAAVRRSNKPCRLLPDRVIPTGSVPLSLPSQAQTQRRWFGQSWEQ
jgi:hypothetical protein